MRLLRHKPQRWHAWWHEPGSYSLFEVDWVRGTANGPVEEELLTAVLETLPVASLSQRIDERLWNKEIRDRIQYVSRIREQYSVDAGITQDFGETLAPSLERPVYAIHVSGRLTLPLMRHITYFRIDSLGTIAYGLTQLPEPWLDTVVKWNRDLIRWFDVKEGDSAIHRVLDETTMVVMAIDGRLTFVGRDEQSLLFVEGLHSDIGERAGLVPIVERKT